MVAIFAAELFHQRWGAGVGALVVVIGAIGWNWPQDAPMTEEEELAFEAEHGVPVHGGGSEVVAQWGMALVVLFLGVAFSAFLLAYFYLRLDNDAWPPPGIPMPSLLVPVLSTVLLVSAALAMHRAVRRIGAGDQGGLKVGLVAALVLGAAAVVVQGRQATRLGFSVSEHAYGSIFHTLGAFVLATAIAALVMAGLALFWAWRGYYTPRRHVTVSTTARFWTAAVVVWVVGLGTLHLGPYLT